MRVEGQVLNKNNNHKIDATRRRISEIAVVTRIHNQELKQVVKKNNNHKIDAEITFYAHQ